MTHRPALIQRGASCGAAAKAAVAGHIRQSYL